MSCLPQPEHHRVRLHILSPIHIGSGQDLDPFSYLIRGKTLFMIDLIRWMESYPEREKLERMMDSDNFADIRSFIAENFNLEEAVRCAVPADCPKLLDIYRKAIEKKDPKNQILISPMTRNEISMEAYIPGSSVKGAIRTALANDFVKAANVTSQDISDYSRKIFGSVAEDPLRRLRLWDIPLGNPGTLIMEAKEYPLIPDKALTPKGHIEVTFSLCHIGKNLMYPLRLSLAPFMLHGQKIDLKFLTESLYRFYVPKYEAEFQTFFQFPRAEKIRESMMIMNQAVAGLRTNESLIRIGHFSHAECVTLDGIRNPKTRMGKDRSPVPWGKTRTLANGLYPFGWAKLEFSDLESAPRPQRKWAFPLEGVSSKVYARVPDLAFTAGKAVKMSLSGKGEKEELRLSQDTAVSSEKLLEELNLIKADDMGRLGTLILKIEKLPTDREKAVFAEAVRDKIGLKAFKKHKKRDYLLEIIGKAESAPKK